jgi:hypothetical protein
MGSGGSAVDAMVIGCLGVERRAERFLSYLAILETFLGKVYEKSGVEFAHWSKLKPGLAKSDCNYSTRKPTATFRHRRSCPRHLAPSISWRRSVHPNVLSSRQRRSPPGALHNSTKNCYANSFQNKCENNFARKARSVEVLNQPSNRKRDSITNHPPPSPNP